MDLKDYIKIMCPNCPPRVVELMKYFWEGKVVVDTPAKVVGKIDFAKKRKLNWVKIYTLQDPSNVPLADAVGVKVPFKSDGIAGVVYSEIPVTLFASENDDMTNRVIIFMMNGAFVAAGEGDTTPITVIDSTTLSSIDTGFYAFSYDYVGKQATVCVISERGEKKHCNSVTLTTNLTHTAVRVAKVGLPMLSAVYSASSGGGSFGAFSAQSISIQPNIDVSTTSGASEPSNVIKIDDPYTKGITVEPVKVWRDRFVAVHLPSLVPEADVDLALWYYKRYWNELD